MKTRLFQIVTQLGLLTGILNPTLVSAASNYQIYADGTAVATNNIQHSAWDRTEARLNLWMSVPLDRFGSGVTNRQAELCIEVVFDRGGGLDRRCETAVFNIYGQYTLTWAAHSNRIVTFFGGRRVPAIQAISATLQFPGDASIYRPHMDTYADVEIGTVESDGVDLGEHSPNWLSSSLDCKYLPNRDDLEYIHLNDGLCHQVRVSADHYTLNTHISARPTNLILK